MSDALKYAPMTVDYVSGLLTGGNKAKLAKLLGVGRSTVAGWQNVNRRRKGMCGVIPELYLPKVRQMLAALPVKTENADSLTI